MQRLHRLPKAKTSDSFEFLLAITAVADCQIPNLNFQLDMETITVSQLLDKYPGYQVLSVSSRVDRLKV